jgi:hypothetical protein
MIAFDGNFVRDIVNGDDAVKEHQGDEDQQEQGDVFEKHESSLVSADSNSCGAGVDSVLTSSI